MESLRASVISSPPCSLRKNPACIPGGVTLTCSAGMSRDMNLSSTFCTPRPMEMKKTRNRAAVTSMSWLKR